MPQAGGPADGGSRSTASASARVRNEPELGRARHRRPGRSAAGARVRAPTSWSFLGSLLTHRLSPSDRDAVNDEARRPVAGCGTSPTMRDAGGWLKIRSTTGLLLRGEPGTRRERPRPVGSSRRTSHSLTARVGTDGRERSSGGWAQPTSGAVETRSADTVSPAVRSSVREPGVRRQFVPLGGRRGNGTSPRSRSASSSPDGVALRLGAMTTHQVRRRPRSRPRAQKRGGRAVCRRAPDERRPPPQIRARPAGDAERRADELAVGTSTTTRRCSSRAAGSPSRDVDGHEYADFNIADMSMFTGYGPAPVVEAVSDRSPTDRSTCCRPRTRSGSRGAGRRYGLPLWQFTLAATSANTEVIRIAAVVDRSREGAVLRRQVPRPLRRGPGRARGRPPGARGDGLPDDVDRADPRRAVQRPRRPWSARSSAATWRW